VYQGLTHNPDNASYAARQNADPGVPSDNLAVGSNAEGGDRHSGPGDNGGDVQGVVSHVYLPGRRGASLPYSLSLGLLTIVNSQSVSDDG
jgi:hypothetical protein